jgi:hypothetical protein
MCCSRGDNVVSLINITIYSNVGAVTFRVNSESLVVVIIIVATIARVSIRTTTAKGKGDD